MNMCSIKGLLVCFYGKWSVESGQVSTLVRTLCGFSPYSHKTHYISKLTHRPIKQSCIYFKQMQSVP